jgi:hypothetical protein
MVIKIQTIMIRSAFVLLLSLLMSFSVLAQTTKKVARPDIPGSFVFDLGFNRGRLNPQNFVQGFWGSRTVNLYYQYPLRIARTKFSFVPGIGVSLERFKLVNDYTLNPVKDPDGSFSLIKANTLYPGAYKSMIVTDYFEVPVGFRFDTHPEDIARSLSISVGGRAGVLFDGFTKLKYTQDGETKTMKDKQNHGLNPIRYGLYARLGIGGFNFFTFYNLSPLFVTNKGPAGTAMTTFTIGVSINGF